MGALLSSGHKVTDKDRAILDLKVQRDKLKQYSKKVVTTVSRVKIQKKLIFGCKM
jgi:charged multivesicular body protein 6